MCSTPSQAVGWTPSEADLQSASSTAILDRGWRQGSVLSPRLTKHLKSEDGDELVLVLVSHDCDIVNHDFDAEPCCEVWVGRIVDEADGNKVRGKNPRVIHLRVPTGDTEKVVEGLAHHREFIDRRLLALDDPASVLDNRARTELTRWLAARYIRAAFPDEFNERVRPAIKKVGKLVGKPVGEYLSGIYMLVPDEELDVDSSYDVIVRGTMLVDHFDDPRTREEVTKLLDKVVAAIDGCDGITVYDHEVVSEGKFSLDDLRLMKRWDWDHISLKPDPAHDLAPSP